MKSLESQLDHILKTFERNDSKKSTSSRNMTLKGHPRAGHVANRIMFEDFARSRR